MQIAINILIIFRHAYLQLSMKQVNGKDLKSIPKLFTNQAITSELCCKIRTGRML